MFLCGVKAYFFFNIQRSEVNNTFENQPLNQNGSYPRGKKTFVVTPAKVGTFEDDGILMLETEKLAFA